MKKGQKHSEESRAKMRLARLGKKSDKPSKLKGRKIAEETRLKIKKSLVGRVYPKGIPKSEETKRKISVALKGRPSIKKGIPMSEEQKIKISNSKKGISYVNKGVKRNPLTEEHKQRIAESHKKSGFKPPSALGRKQTQETINKRTAKVLGQQRPSMRGANNSSWKGGVTPENQKIRQSLEYKEWRRSVFKRDNYTCVLCGAKSGKGNPVVIHADHIKPFAYYPELRFELSNGRTLCEPCHRETDNYAGKGFKRKNKIYDLHTVGSSF